MNQTITIEVPESIAEQYMTWEELTESVYESMVIREFQKGMLTIHQSAQILGLTYDGFMEWLGARGLSFITATPQELEESYNNFEKFMQALSRIDRLDIFQILFEGIYIPDSVYQETAINATLVSQKEAILAAIQTETIKVIEPSVSHNFSRKLGLGEQGVLNLAIEKGTQQIIMDDKKARNEARELGFPVAYTADILKIAANESLIDSYTNVFNQLNSMGIYLPE